MVTDILVDTHSDGWSRRGYVALLPGPATEIGSTLAELVAVLKEAGVHRAEIRLAGDDDGDHAMSTSERAELWASWGLGG